MDYGEVLRVVKKSNLVTRGFLDRVDLKEITREEILGLEYREGEEVIDLVTGQRGRVVAGATTYITKVPGA